ncbi:MAG: RNA methyltransferase [Candidatus Limnocylindrales bacterium]
MTSRPDLGVTLTSASNPRIRAAIALRDRRERESSGLTLVDGARELRRAIDAGVEIVEAFVCEPLLAGPDARAVLDDLQKGGAPVHATSEAAFGRLAFGDRAEGFVAVVRSPSLGLDRLKLGPDPLVLVVESVEKPGNLGAILRSADGAGVDAVIAASPRTDLFNPNVIRASAGTVFSVPSPRLRARTCLPGCVRRAYASSRHEWTVRVPTRTRTCAARWRSPSGRKQTV